MVERESASFPLGAIEAQFELHWEPDSHMSPSSHQVTAGVLCFWTHWSCSCGLWPARGLASDWSWFSGPPEIPIKPLLERVLAFQSSNVFGQIYACQQLFTQNKPEKKKTYEDILQLMSPGSWLETEFSALSNTSSLLSSLVSWNGAMEQLNYHHHVSNQSHTHKRQFKKSRKYWHISWV